MAKLAKQIECLVRCGLTIIVVVAAFIARHVQPLQQRVQPFWEYNGENDSTRAMKETFANQTA